MGFCKGVLGFAKIATQDYELSFHSHLLQILTLK